MSASRASLAVTGFDSGQPPSTTLVKATREMLSRLRLEIGWKYHPGISFPTIPRNTDPSVVQFRGGPTRKTLRKRLRPPQLPRLGPSSSALDPLCACVHQPTLQLPWRCKAAFCDDDGDVFLTRLPFKSFTSCWRLRTVSI